jgi:hypothetical protein
MNFINATRRILMLYAQNWKTAAAVLVLIIGFLWAGAAGAQSRAGMVGWEKKSEYNALYKASEMDQFKGTVESISEIKPLSNMDPGVGLTVIDQDGEKINVHIGPKSFVNIDSIGLRKGDKIKLRGVWADIDDEEVFLASKIKKGETELKVRKTSDGTPFWTMTAEELAAEQKGAAAADEE